MSENTLRLARVSQLDKALRNRELIWFGIRGEDATPLLALDAFRASYALTAKVGGASLDPTRDVTLEAMSGDRVDLDMYDLDFDQSDAGDRFRSELLDALSTSCVLLTYRPSGFTSALAFSMRRTLTLAGMHKDRQRAFEHKPWVETELEARGVRTLGWTYVADSRRSVAAREIERGPHVLRTSRDSGGVGISLVTSPEELDKQWPQQSDQFVAVAPYIAEAVPVNLAGCVFTDGAISTHPPSVQLIGIDGMTTRPFGYCGNDFAAVKDLTPRSLATLHEMLETVGGWLHQERYRGGFGLDALVRGDEVWFTEVNARLQGSTWLGAQIAQRMQLPDLLLDHLAANLGLPLGAPSPTVPEWVQQQPDLAHLVVHNVDATDLANDLDGAPAPDGERWGLDPGMTTVKPGGVLGRLMWLNRLTEDGSSVTSVVHAAAERRRSQFGPVRDEGGGV